MLWAARRAAREPAASSLRSRGVVGIAIVAAHMVVIAVLARSSLVQPTRVQSAPLIVDLVDRPKPQQEILKVPDLKLAPIQPVLITPPEVNIPVEPQTTAITATVAAAIPATAPMSDQSSDRGDPPSMSDVAYLRKPAPRYPSESRHAHEEGLVVLRALIDASGRAKSIIVYKSSGHPRLDEAARSAVERAVFKPYLERGIARSALATIPVEFSLRGAKS